MRIQLVGGLFDGTFVDIDQATFLRGVYTLRDVRADGKDHGNITYRRKAELTVDSDRWFLAE